MSPVLHYLDDFLINCSSMSPLCSIDPKMVTEVCLYLGIPLAVEKLEGPTESLTFLGIVLDVHHMEAHLLPAKLQYIHSEVAVWLKREMAQKGLSCHL